MNKVRVTAEELIAMEEDLILFEEKALEEFTILAERLERIEDYLFCRESINIKRKVTELKKEAAWSFENLRIHIRRLSDIAKEYNEAEGINIELVENAIGGG